MFLMGWPKAKEETTLKRIVFISWLQMKNSCRVAVEMPAAEARESLRRDSLYFF